MTCVALLFLSVTSALSADIEYHGPHLLRGYRPVPAAHDIFQGTLTNIDEIVEMHFEHHFVISGPIELGDAARFEDMASIVDSPFSSAIVTLNSEGGNYEEALQIGDIISGKSMTTAVLEADVCKSACALILLAGSEQEVRNSLPRASRFIYMGADVGFHAPYVDLRLPNDERVPPSTLANIYYSAASTSLRKLINRMSAWNIPSDFVDEFLQIEPKQVLSIDTLEALYAGQFQLLSNKQLNKYRGPRAITVLEAQRSCQFLNYHVAAIVAHIANPNSAHKAASRVYKLTGTLIEAITDDGVDRIVLTGFVPGVGNYECSLVSEDGEWSMYSEGGLRHTIAHNVNEVVTNGMTVSWKKRNTSANKHLEQRLASMMQSYSLDELGGNYCANSHTEPETFIVCSDPVTARIADLHAHLIRSAPTRDSEFKQMNDWRMQRIEGCLVGRYADIETYRIAECLAHFYIGEIDSRFKTSRVTGD